MILWREARRSDVGALIALLSDDVLGQTRECGDPAPYLAAFDRMQRESENFVIVGEDKGRIVATYQLTFISGLSLRGARRAQLESVRIAGDLRGQGLGAALMADAETRARAAGCRLLQLTTNATRERAHAFYARLGFTASHIGFKRDLDARE